MSHACPNCGTLNLDSYRFCSNCGAAIGSDTKSTQPVTPGSAINIEATNNAVPPPASYLPPPVAPGSQANAATSQPASEQPAYIVKTSPDAGNFAAPAPPAPGGNFGPPIPGAPPPGGQGLGAQYTGYQGNRPGASAGKEGGVFTPYPAATATALEKPKETRSWLMPVAIVAALLVVGLVAIGFYVSQQNKASTSGTGNTVAVGLASPTPKGQPGVSGKPTEPNSGGGMPTPAKPQATPTDLPASASEEDRVRAVIRRSNDQQIRAWEELNADYLNENYTGQALQDNIDQVNQLKQRNMYAIPVNTKLDILDVKIDGDKAAAHTIEVWTVTYVEKATNKRTTTEPSTFNETYNLVKKNGKWMISDLVIPTPVPSVPATPTRSGA